MYQEDFPADDSTTENMENCALMVEKIRSDSLSKQDIQIIEPVFNYGHMDVHQYLKAKKRFVWF